MPAKPLHLRLFVEGFEIPVISANVSMNTNAPATAAIQIIPLDSAMEFKPRTMVHLFYLDAAARADEKGSVTFSRTEGVYRLLFAGEVHGYSYAQTPQSRSLTLQCLDFSSYWDSAHATAIEYGPFGNAFTHKASLYGGDPTQFDDIVNQQANVVLRWIRSKPFTPGLQNVGGLAGGIIHMMEAMGGYSENGKHRRGINDFFTVAELRCKLLNQITAEDPDNTAAQLMANKVLDEWLHNALANAGQQVTFRDMMLMLMQYIYYETVPISTPYWTSYAEGSSKAVPGEKRVLVKTSAGSAAITNIDSAIGWANTARKGVETGTPAAELQKNLATNINSDIQKALASLKRIVSAASDVVKVRGHLTTAQAAATSIAVGSPCKEKFTTAWKNLTDAKTIIENSKQTVEVGSGTVQTTASSQRLRTQIIRPDCWFAVPPACNIIFPEHYVQITYDRNFTQEVTRVLIQAYLSLIGKDALLASRVLAPNPKDLLSSQRRGSKGQSSWDGSYRELMQHEYHTGIIPREEWLPDTHSFSKPGAVPKTQEQVAGERTGWATKAALHHFFKYRFAPRQVSVAGRFNPNIACGFPGAVIRAPFIVPDEVLAEHKDNKDLLRFVASSGETLGAPYHFVGMIAGVTHQINQDGGSTSVSMHSVRRHAGTDDEFLGIIKNTEKPETRIVKVVLTAEKAKVNERLFQMLRKITPQGKPSTAPTMHGRLDNGVWVDLPGPAVPLYTTRGDIPDAEKANVLVPLGDTEIKAGDSSGFFTASPIVGIEVVADSGEQSVVEVYREANLYKKVIVYQKVEVPAAAQKSIEQMLMPSWFSPSYGPTRIGKEVYQQFFGCGSVLDAVSFAYDIGTSRESPTVEAVGSDGKVVGDFFVQELKETLVREDELSLERALNILAYIYGQVRQTGKDVESFLQQITYRPIATKEQVLWEDGLEFDIQGDKISVKALPLEDTEAYYPQMGFHATALHPTLINHSQKLMGLTYDPDLKMQRASGHGKDQTLDPRYDVRKEKWDRVKTYHDALVGSSGRQGFRG